MPNRYPAQPSQFGKRWRFAHVPQPFIETPQLPWRESSVNIVTLANRIPMPEEFDRHLSSNRLHEHLTCEAGLLRFLSKPH